MNKKMLNNMKKVRLFLAKEDNSKSKDFVDIDYDSIIVIHDNNNTEGNWFNVITTFHAFTVIKDEDCKLLFKRVKEDSKFQRAYTRFGDYLSEQIGTQTSWEDGKRFLLYYRKDLPVISFKDRRMICSYVCNFQIEI